MYYSIHTEQICSGKVSPFNALSLTSGLQWRMRCEHCVWCHACQASGIQPGSSCHGSSDPWRWCPAASWSAGCQQTHKITLFIHVNHRQDRSTTQDHPITQNYSTIQYFIYILLKHYAIKTWTYTKNIMDLHGVTYILPNRSRFKSQEAKQQDLHYTHTHIPPCPLPKIVLKLFQLTDVVLVSACVLCRSCPLAPCDLNCFNSIAVFCLRCLNVDQVYVTSELSTTNQVLLSLDF